MAILFVGQNPVPPVNIPIQPLHRSRSSKTCRAPKASAQSLLRNPIGCFALDRRKNQTEALGPMGSGAVPHGCFHSSFEEKRGPWQNRQPKRWQREKERQRETARKTTRGQPRKRKPSRKSTELSSSAFCLFSPRPTDGISAKWPNSRFFSPGMGNKGSKQSPSAWEISQGREGLKAGCLAPVSWLFNAFFRLGP